MAEKKEDSFYAKMTKLPHKHRSRCFGIMGEAMIYFFNVEYTVDFHH
jgi:hypothetical protein